MLNKFTLYLFPLVLIKSSDSSLNFTEHDKVVTIRLESARSVSVWYLRLRHSCKAVLKGEGFNHPPRNVEKITVDVYFP